MRRPWRLVLLLPLGGCSLLAPPPAAPQPEAPAPVVAPAPPPPAPVPVPPSAALILDRTASEVQAILGHPSLVRREEGAQMMQFADPACVLDVVLYPPAPGAHFRARHLAARTPAGAPLDAAACLARLIPEDRWPRAVPETQAGLPG